MFSNNCRIYTGKDTVVSDEYGAEVEQGRCPRQQQQPNEQKKPGQEPDWQTPEQPPLSHLATLRCKQSQLDGRVTIDSTGLSRTDEEDQGVKKR